MSRFARKSQKRKEEEIFIRKNVQRNKDHLSIREVKALTEPQRQMIKSFVSGSNIIAVGSAGTGKAQPLHSKILLESGWCTIGEVKVGDIVITPNNSSATILEIFEQGIKPVYKMHFKDGSVVESCGEHLWEVYVPKSLNYRRYSTKEILQTKELSDILKNKSKSVNISIDYVDRINLPTRDLEMDPYILGCILGDGGTTSGSIVITSGDAEIVSGIERRLKPGFKLSFKKNSNLNCSTFSIIKDLPRGRNEYIEILTKFGLMGVKSTEKFIPSDYINSSVEQRLELIRGLFDTDGTASKGGRVTYSTSSEIMAKQVKEVILSLGGKCTISSKSPFYYDESRNRIYGKVNYILHVKTKNDKELFNLTRKKNLASSNYQPNQFRRIISKIEYSGDFDCRCILIDDPKHLYITDSYVITHNTFCALYLALRDVLEYKNRDKIIIVRSNVPTRNSGFLPGSLEEKNEIYALPSKQIVNDLCQNGTAWEILTRKQIIEFTTTSYVRGLTFDNAVILLEECQNLDSPELISVLTRLGENSKIIISGDTNQSDLFRSREKSCYDTLMYISDRMQEHLDTIHFYPNDIVRSEFVKTLITILEDQGK